jgi:hypothetical protein
MALWLPFHYERWSLSISCSYNYFILFELAKDSFGIHSQPIGPRLDSGYIDRPIRDISPVLTGTYISSAPITAHNLEGAPTEVDVILHFRSIHRQDGFSDACPFRYGEDSIKIPSAGGRYISRDILRYLVVEVSRE